MMQLMMNYFQMNCDVSVHQMHLYSPVTEVFKSVNNLNSHFMGNYFKMNFLPYDLREGNILDCTFLQHSQIAMEQIYSYYEVVLFGITFLERLRKASPLNNSRKD